MEPGEVAGGREQVQWGLLGTATHKFGRLNTYLVALPPALYLQNNRSSPTALPPHVRYLWAGALQAAEVGKQGI